MPSNPVNMRSTVFAFKCKMGTPLTRIDFNLVLRSNEVKQLYFTVEDNVHLVCMRLKEAVTRQRFMNALCEIMRKPLANFRHPVRGVTLDWSDVVFSGSQLREEGTGFEIRQTLKRHMDTNHPAFFQSHSTTTRHATHMLQNIMRRNPYSPAQPQSTRRDPAVVAQPPPTTPSTPSDAETLPVSPQPSLHGREDSARTIVYEQQSDVFSAPIIMPNGSLNMVETTAHIREVATSVIRDLLQVSPGFNLQGTLRDMSNAMNEILETTSRIQEELTRARQE